MTKFWVCGVVLQKESTKVLNKGIYLAFLYLEYSCQQHTLIFLGDPDTDWIWGEKGSAGCDVVTYNASDRPPRVLQPLPSLVQPHPYLQPVMTSIGLSHCVLKDWRHCGLGECRHFPGFSLANHYQSTPYRLLA